MANIFRLEMLPAHHGDALWIEYGDETRLSHILIDGGTKGTYTDIRRLLKALPEDERHIELLVITHVDADHIEGVLKLFDDNSLNATLGEIWFNGWRHLSEIEEFGPVQGERLTDALWQQKEKWNSSFAGKAISVPDNGDLPHFTLPGGMKLTLISPGKDQLSRLQPVWEEKCREAGLDPIIDREELVEIDGIESFGGLPDVDALAAKDFSKDESEANGSSIAFIAEFGRT